MNIDERLDRLVERHEALTETVEHLALQGEEHNKQLQIQRENIDRILLTTDKILIALQKDSENIRALARIAELHDRRLTDLEDGTAER